ncbi:hypothetical protein ACFGVS_24025 [Mucilaginibacter sp. AW1-7]|jgi:hypothetical protein|uniref:hypothetical protein n=1 Tax=Mucilaginibacter sp. AW1-7 TaxID=3349874 RepID=UPI003F73A690
MWNLRFVQDYLQHRITANNRHGIHSPFVYKLIDHVIYDYTDQKVYHEPGFVQKTGEGSVGLKPKVVRLIYRLAKYFNPANIIELGAKGGKESVYLQQAAPNANFFLPKNDAEFARLDKTQPALVIFHVDNLRQETIRYFDQYLPEVHPDTIMLFTGMYLNNQLKQTWNQIKLNPNVTLTINLFWIGLVFFKQDRKEKEHFKVRY